MVDHSGHTANTGWRFLDWFTGGSAHPYMRLVECMSADWTWIAITVGLDLAVATGYALIALHWWKNSQLVPGDSPPKRALDRIRNIFIFCGLCGYIFIPIKMVWPAWRLYDLFMLILAYYTWRYALGARGLKVLYSEFGRSEKLASDLKASQEESQRKSAFLNAVSHDLRTPLNGMTLQADLATISAEAGDSTALKTALAEIKTSAAATAELLNRFLELGRIDWSAEPNRIEETPAARIVAAIGAGHEAQASAKGLSLSFSGADGLLLRTDRLKVERILNNLLANAVKFTEQGGVTVSVEPRGADLRVEVADTGVGMPAEERRCLFDEFFQLRNHERDRTKGFGLGLAISRRLARQLGGDVSLVQSEVGRGSRFRLELPGVVAGRAGQEAAGPAFAHGGNGAGPAVIVAAPAAAPGRG
jgi:two-component system, sensor histidine kinase